MTATAAVIAVTRARGVTPADGSGGNERPRDNALVPTATRLPAFLADHPHAAGTLVLTGGRLFDGTGSGVRDGATVIVREGRVEAVAAAGDGMPEGAAVVDLAGRTLLPGLIDAHAHLTMTGHSLALAVPGKGAEPYDPALPGHLAAATLRRALRMGVTSCSACGRRCATPRSRARGCSSAAGSSRPPRRATASSQGCTGRRTGRMTCDGRSGSRSARAPTS
jgi:hypothetical protein